MLSTTSVSDPGWAWGYMGEQDAPALEERAAGAANTLTHLCSLNSHPVHPGNPRCSEHSGCFTTISVWPHSPPWLAGSLVAGFSYHLFWVDLHVSPRGVCLFPPPILVGSVSSIQLCSQRFPLSRVSTWRRAGLRK